MPVEHCVDLGAEGFVGLTPLLGSLSNAVQHACVADGLALGILQVLGNDEPAVEAQPALFLHSLADAQ